MKRILNSAVLAAIMVAGICGLLQGQTIWMNGDSSHALNLDFRKPSLDLYGNNEPSLYTMYAGLQAWLGSNSHLVCELPIAYVSYEYYSHDKRQISIGNPYLGIRYTGRGAITEFGMRLPTSGDYNIVRVLGSQSALDRLGAFTPKVLTLRFAANIKATRESEGFVRFGTGGVLLVPTSGENQDAELLGQYGLQAGYDGARAFVGIAFNGLLWISQSGLGYGNRTLHYLDFNGIYRAGRIQPGIYLMIPMDDDSSAYISSVIGISLTYSFSSATGGEK